MLEERQENEDAGALARVEDLFPQEGRLGASPDAFLELLRAHQPALEGGNERGEDVTPERAQTRGNGDPGEPGSPMAAERIDKPREGYRGEGAAQRRPPACLGMIVDAADNIGHDLAGALLLRRRGGDADGLEIVRAEVFVDVHQVRIQPSAQNSTAGGFSAPESASK